jgi:endonuclease III
MVREPLVLKRARARRIFASLARAMPDAKIELAYQSPMELLVAVMLSAQCTDKRVNLVTPPLFRHYRTVRSFAHAQLGELQSLIRTCGLFRTKAKNIIAAAQAIAAQHGGRVPRTREELETLPGVGHKTAGVVCNHLGDERAFPVDTHIQRLAWRIGLSRQRHPDKVEEDLQQLFPAHLWSQGHQLLIWHGRRVCSARSPACERCVVFRWCERRGVGPPTSGARATPRPKRQRRARP